jgi:hypothetical protein
MELADGVLSSAESPCLIAPSAVIAGLCGAIARNLDGPVESALAAKLLVFTRSSTESAVAVALHGSLSFLCGRSLQGAHQRNSHHLLRVLQTHTLPPLRAMVSVYAHELMPLLYLSDMGMLTELLCRPGSDGKAALVKLLGSADVHERTRAAQAVQSCLAKLQLRPAELPELPDMIDNVHNFADMVGDEMCSDVTFAVEGRRIPAHRICTALVVHFCGLPRYADAWHWGSGRRDDRD